ncbi:MAG: hypothetical protein EHM89_00095 [Acidobacteria bacterium]|nr:MAG: hypothetical protein EHM89_00095 [Acidobacteriota bacterium]
MTRVLLDCDGILSDFISAYLRIVNRVTGLRFVPEQVTEFDINKSIGLSASDASLVKRAVGESPALATALAVYPGSRDGVAALQRIADVYVVTSPWNSNPTWTHDREWWLQKHFDIPAKRVIHTAAKHVCRGDVLIDDKVSTVQLWRAEYPDALGVVWSTPHNQNDSDAGPRTNDWSELCELIRRRS